MSAVLPLRQVRAFCPCSHGRTATHARDVPGRDAMRVIDFNAVPFHHERMDERLKNWARWASGRPGGGVHPMFRHYRPDNFEREMSEPIDALDAQAIQKGVSALPTRHRLALSWCYITPGSPGRMARKTGESIEGLFGLISDARQMLINRRI
jgi:hypothetical protein